LPISKKAKPREIKSARLAACLTQKQAAELIHYSERAWQEWEAGRRRMRASTLNNFRRLAGL
jgi:DNA-binding transcriptional regulator YiaG